MSDLKKIVLAAVFFGILLGATMFFSSPSVTESRNVMLQNTVLPQTNGEAGQIRGNQSVWSAAIGLLLGSVVGFTGFLIAKRRV